MHVLVHFSLALASGFELTVWDSLFYAGALCRWDNLIVDESTQSCVRDVLSRLAMA